MLAGYGAYLVMSSGPGGRDPNLALDFRLETLDHDRFYLNQQRGRVVVLIFWTTTCLHCKEEMIALESLRKEFEQEALTVAGVCSDPENLDTARRIVERLEIGFPTLLDREGRVSKLYEVGAFPTTVLIGPSGQTDLNRAGYDEGMMRQIRDRVESLLP